MSSRCRPTFSRSLGRTHDPDNVVSAVDAVRAARAADVQPRPHLRRGRRVRSTTGSTPSTGRLAARSATRLGVRPHGRSRARHLPSQPDRHPDDDDQADKYELVDERLTAAGLANYEVSNWARAGARVGDTTSCTGASRTTAGSAVPRTRTRTVVGGGTFARPIATSTWSSAGRVGRSVVGDAWPPMFGGSRASS